MMIALQTLLRPGKLIFVLTGLICILIAEATSACDFNPTAVMNHETGAVFIDDDTVLLSGSQSTANNCSGYIDQYRWQVRPVGGSWTTLYTGTSSTYSYSFPTLSAGENQKDYQVRLRVRNNMFLYNTKTITVTVARSHKSYYYLTDHLGSVRVTVNDAGDPVGWDDYYPFGLQMPERTQNASNPNDDAKFTGYLLEQDGDLEIYHAEARFYDPVIGRFMSVDPLASKYPSLSPYTYVANNPVNAFDPDGRLIVFINGMHGGSGAWPRSDRYWSDSGYFAHAVMDHFNDYNAVFVDGSVGGFKNTATYASLLGRAGAGNLSSAYRYEAGYSRGRRDAAKLIGLLAPEETLKIITHSMGQVYGKGYVKAIMEYIRNSKDPKVRKTLVSLVADFDPFQAASSFGSAHPDIFTQQFWHDGGWFGIADQLQDGAKDKEDKEKKRHALNTFLGDIERLQEGTYAWDDKKEEWICTNCKN